MFLTPPFIDQAITLKTPGLRGLNECNRDVTSMMTCLAGLATIAPCGAGFMSSAQFKVL
jgi:hypothetical protein